MAIASSDGLCYSHDVGVDLVVLDYIEFPSYHLSVAFEVVDLSLVKCLACEKLAEFLAVADLVMTIHSD